MEVATVWSLVHGAPWWTTGLVVGLVAALTTAALLRLSVRRRAARGPSLEDDSTYDDDEAAGGFRSSRFAARVCAACSRPMLLETDGRWRCAADPACRG